MLLNTADRRSLLGKPNPLKIRLLNRSYGLNRRPNEIRTLKETPRLESDTSYVLLVIYGKHRILMDVDTRWDRSSEISMRRAAFPVRINYHFYK